MKPKKSELQAWIRAEIANAKGYDSDELAQVRDMALRSYRGEQVWPAPEGRSDQQSNDVADMVEAIVSQVLPAFSQDAIAAFEPLPGEDEDAVQAETNLINQIIVEQNRGYVMFQESLRDALLIRNGWTRVELDESESVRVDTYDSVPPEAAAQIVMNADAEGEVEVINSGAAEEEGNRKLELRVTIKRKAIRVRSVDPILMSWNRDHDSVFLDGVRFLSERWHPTRSELIAMGYSRKAVESVQGYSGPTEPQDTARDPTQSVQGALPRDHATQRVRARWLHYRYDSDGDGIAELHRILFLDDASEPGHAILEDEIVDFVPYATGTPILQPHRLDGLGVWDKLKEIEKGKTKVLRQWLDNQATSNNPALIVNSNVLDPQTVAVRRPGGVYGVDGLPGDAAMPLPVVDIGGSCLTALEYFDKIRSERAGASLDLQSQQTRIAGDTAHGIERQISAKELMAAMMTRTLAETLVRQTYLLTHTACRRWLNEEVQLRIRGEAVSVNPATFPMRDRVNVQTGLSVSERSARRQALEVVLAEQKVLWQAGEDGVLVDREGYHSALVDWTRAAQIDNGERYFLDPRSEPSRKAQQGKSQQQEQDKQVQIQLAEMAANAEANQQIVANGLEAWKTEQDNALEVWKETLRAELELIKLGDGAGSGADVTRLQQAGGK